MRQVKEILVRDRAAKQLARQILVKQRENIKEYLKKNELVSRESMYILVKQSITKPLDLDLSTSQKQTPIVKFAFYFFVIGVVSVLWRV